VNRKILVGIAAILCVLFLTQTSAVYAAKPEKTYFFAPDGEWTIDDSSIIYNDDGTLRIGQFFLSGNMRKTGFFGPVWATFTCVETITYYYDSAGVLKYLLRDGLVTITIDAETTLIVDFKLKSVVGVPLEFQRAGSWVVVGGTGLYDGASGRGEYRFPFQFYGTLS